MTETPLPASRRTTSNSFSVSVSVSAAVGSSRMRILQVARQRLGDLDDLRLRRRKRRHFERRIDGDAELGDQRLGACRACARTSTWPSHCVGCRPAKMFSATESCGTSEPSWWTMPMPRSPAAFSSSAPISAPSTRMLPCVARIDAGDDLAERRLAGAVLAEQRADLAGLDAHRHVVERPHAGEELRQVLDRRAAAPWQRSRPSPGGSGARPPGSSRPSSRCAGSARRRGGRHRRWRR